MVILTLGIVTCGNQVGEGMQRAKDGAGKGDEEWGVGWCLLDSTRC